MLVLLAFVCLSGCSEPEVRVRALPAPPAETPPVNLPSTLRQRNWTVNDEGSCVYASLISHVQWQHKPKLAAYIRKNFGGGEYDTRLRKNLDSLGIPYDYTLRADPRFLDWSSATRRGAILWWKPYHCCTFMGWATGSDGRQYATILDNNFPERFEAIERSQFLRLWAGYGGFALTVLDDPANHIPWRSYERL
jgi:hypothetical protein